MVTLLEVSEKEEAVVALHLPIGPLKKTLWVGAGTEMRTTNRDTNIVHCLFVCLFI